MVEKIGPYRVYERLGVGGMGEVYKAYDDRLERWVAIKRIRPDREDADDNRERFKREARATARLNHPSIVHLYGIFQEGDSDCIVMEYVEGETLDKKLVNGPLDPLESATLGHEIASGLAEAHANGILHRDLKAENIIITPKGRSKILDFGLAKPILAGELDPVLTGKGQLVGTSRAMSPEYVGGEDIDHRSDLFALGVLIYECLTGQSPFKAHNTLATLKQVMLHKQTPIREINPNVPPSLSKLIDRLLAKDPAERPQSAQDVAISFGDLCGKMSSSQHDRPTGSFLDSTSAVVKKQAAKAFAASETVLDLRPPRRWMTGLIVLGVLLVGAFFLGRYLNRPPDVAPLPEGGQIRVVLGDFLNQTGEGQFDIGLQQALRVAIEQSRSVQTLPASMIRDTLARMEKPPDLKIDREVAIEIAKREGAHRVVLGEIQKFGTKYSLLIQVVAPENDITSFSASESAQSPEGILSALETLTKAVRRHLGESADQIDQSTLALEKVTTPDFEALRAYTLGEQRLAREHYSEAISLFRRALELDSSFGMAHAKLVMAYSNLGDIENAAQQALEAQRHSDRLAEEERFYVDGWVARWHGTPQDVIDVWSLYRDLYPGKFVGHNNLGMAYWYYRNNFPAASESLDKAVRTAEVPIQKHQALSALGISLIALERFNEAEPLLMEAGPPAGVEGLVLLRAVEGNFTAAEKLVESLTDIDRRDRYRVVVASSRGLLREALQMVNSTLKRWSESGTDGVRPDLRMHAVTSKVALAAALSDQSELRTAVQNVEHLATELELYSRDPDARSAPMVAIGIKRLSRLGLESDARALRKLLGEPASHTQEIVLALVDVADAELAMAAGHLELAETYLASSMKRAETVTAHESRGHLMELLEDWTGAIEEYSWVANRPGLAYVECSFACSSITNGALVWSSALFRLGAVYEEAGETTESISAYSRLIDRWRESDSAEVRIARSKVRTGVP